MSRHFGTVRRGIFGIIWIVRNVRVLENSTVSRFLYFDTQGNAIPINGLILMILGALYEIFDCRFLAWTCLVAVFGS